MPLARHDVVFRVLLLHPFVSTHMPLARHDWILFLELPGRLFLLTCLLRGMTYSSLDAAAILKGFLLTCLLRGMTFSKAAWMPNIQFLLTCLLRGMTMVFSLISASLEFLLTCLLRGMTVYTYTGDNEWKVSTHMPLARHDSHPPGSFICRTVSTHMPLARHDNIHWCFLLGCMFLLTCLLRGMTTLPSIGIITERVSTHMPLARHDMFLDRFCNLMDVSTHMPLARHDLI